MTTLNVPNQSLPLGEKLQTFARDIKISHTVFALPWAILATFVAADGMPRLGHLGLILVCMVTARTFAMAANRLLDARLDAMNPRTAGRAIPAGKLSAGFVAAMLAISGLGFIAGTAGFLVYGSIWPIVCSVPVLLFVGAYPFLKRFTQLCHYYLGAALALAPICAYVAIAGTLDFPPLLMAAAVLLWTAGFDILYACQDYDADVRLGVFSVPSKFGIGGALWIARMTHLLAAGALVALGVVTEAFDLLYFCGAGIAIVLLVVEHSLVRRDDLSRLNLAFFTINGVISLLLGILGTADVLL
jgi:4-hydroxybenzoate polyprenyltransferase